MAKEKENEKGKKKDDKEEREEARKELITNLKATKQLFFAWVPKGSRGQLVICKSKSERDKAAAAARKEIGGSTPLTGMCSGSHAGKVFKLDKKPADADRLGAAISKVLKESTKLSVTPNLQMRGPIAPPQPKAPEQQA